MKYNQMQWFGKPWSVIGTPLFYHSIPQFNYGFLTMVYHGLTMVFPISASDFKSQSQSDPNPCHGSDRYFLTL